MTIYSAYSSVTSGATYAGLEAPAGLAAAAVSETEISVVWTDSNEAVSGFVVERSDDGVSGWAEVGTPAAPAFADSSLAPGQTFHYRVRAFRSGSIEYSPYAGPAVATTASPTPAPPILRLFLLSPQVVFRARVNQADIVYPLDQVHFDDVSAGSYEAIRPGMTVLFGSFAGDDERGRQRIRLTPTADTLYIGRSSRGMADGEVEIEDDSHITILSDWRVWAKIPFIAPNGDIFKDSTLPVGDLTKFPPPVANCGPGTAGTIDPDSGALVVAFDGSASFAVADGATITAYAWDGAGSTVIDGASDSAFVTLAFPPGFYWVTLTVQDSNGKVHSARCPVFARDPANDACIRAFEIESHRITPQGQQLSVRVREDIPLSTYPDGTLILLWQGEPASPSDRSHMQFIGWIQSEQLSQQAERTGLMRDTTLVCVDVAGRLDALPGFSQLIEGADEPSKWTEMADPNIDKYLHYLLQWHSTALELADWAPSGTGADFPFVVLSSEGASLWDQASKRAQALVPDHLLTCNRRGQLRTVVDPMLQNGEDRTETEQAHILLSDWSALRSTRQRPPRVHWLRGSAIKAHTSEVSALFAIAPGDTPGQGETEQTHSEQLARSQVDLNVVTGHRYARLNAPQGRFAITLANSALVDGLEPADLTWLRVTVSEAQRSPTVWTNRGLVQEISIRYEHGRTGLTRTVDLQWELETAGNIAATVIVPAAEPVDDGGWWTPPPPDWTPPIYGDPTVYYGPPKGYLLWDGAHVLRCPDILDSSPTWSLVDSGLSGAIRDIQYVHTGPDAVGGWCMTATGIYWCDDLLASTPSWTLKLAITTVRAADATPATGDVHFKTMAHYPSEPGYLCVATGPLATDTQNLTYAHAYFWHTHDFGETWTQVDANNLVVTTLGNTRGYCYSSLFAMAIFHTPPGTLYCFRNAPTVGASGPQRVLISTDLGHTWALANATFSAGLNSRQLLALSHPFPSSNSTALAIQGQLGTSQRHKLHYSQDEWDSRTQIVDDGTPTGYGGVCSLWRPNTRTFDDAHILAWFRHSSDGNCHLLESTDRGASWDFLYDSGLTEANVPNTGVAANVPTSRHATPNGWPADVNIWFLVRAVVGGGSVTNVIMSTQDGFTTAPVSRVGNLASVLPGGSSGWTNGPCGGAALPRVGNNA